MLAKTYAFVRTNYGDTSPFSYTCGVLQGAVLSPLLFIIFLSPLIEALKPHGFSLDQVIVAALLFADDICLLALSAEQRILVEKATAFLNRWNSAVTLSKSALLSPALSPDDYSLEVIQEVTHHRYLGVLLSNSNVYTYTHASSRVTLALAVQGCPE